MNRRQKRALAEAFCPPAPWRKETFLRTLPPRRISNMTFLLTQASCIPPWIWTLCALPFPALLLNARLSGKSALWILCALMPFVAMSAVSECTRSASCRMRELEMASRFSLKSVVLARMGIMGLFHLALLCLLAPLIWLLDGLALFSGGICLLTSYLLTTLLCLECTRRLRGREALYACTGAALMVSGLSIFLQEKQPGLYRQEYALWWAAAVILLLFPVLYEMRRTIHETEELIWS